jgi:hypothetical protein
MTLFVWFIINIPEVLISLLFIKKNIKEQFSIIIPLILTSLIMSFLRLINFPPYAFPFLVQLFFVFFVYLVSNINPFKILKCSVLCTFVFFFVDVFFTLLLIIFKQNILEIQKDLLVFFVICYTLIPFKILLINYIFYRRKTK